MKQNTARMILEVIRNVKGCFTALERWVREEGKLGSVSLGTPSRKDAPAQSNDVSLSKI